MMNRQEIELVQQSFAKVAPIADTAARLFYSRLFELAPEVRPMFKEDLSEQGAKLMRTLALAVAGLTNLDKILPALDHLGRRHLQYGCTDEHYDIVGEALIWTLEQGLGASFTEPVRAAWVTTYGLVAQVMKAAAAKAGAEEAMQVSYIGNQRASAAASRSREAYESPEFQAWLRAAAYGY